MSVVIYAHSNKPFIDLLRAQVPATRRLEDMGYSLEATDPPNEVRIEGPGGAWIANERMIRATKGKTFIETLTRSDRAMLNAFEADFVAPHISAMLKRAETAQ